MSSISILLQTIAKQFYIRNSGFFILLMFSGLGFLSGKEHVAIATIIVNSTSFICILLFLWCFYIWLTYSFTIKALSTSKNRFLLNIRYFPTSKEIWLLNITQLALNAPIALYGLFLMTYAAKHGQWAHFMIIALYLIAANIIPAIIYRTKLIRFF